MNAVKATSDDFMTYFSSVGEMLDFHREQKFESEWRNVPVSQIHLVPLGKESWHYQSMDGFAREVTEWAIEDTAAHLGLAASVEGEPLYPLRYTAFKSLTDRARISGVSLQKMTRDELADTLNKCMPKYPEDKALVLIRNEKMSAFHSGNEKGYAVLPIDELLEALRQYLDDRFPGNEFIEGYTDHEVSTAQWRFPRQKDDLTKKYNETIEENNGAAMDLMPGIEFKTSDIAQHRASVRGWLKSGVFAIPIGQVLAIKHQGMVSVSDFEEEISSMFSKFVNATQRLADLSKVTLNYPVNAMLAVCKKVGLPKKPYLEAVNMLEESIGDSPVTAHDIYLSMNEVLYMLKNKSEKRKYLDYEEAITRALQMDWKNYDFPRRDEG